MRTIPPLDKPTKYIDEKYFCIQGSTLWFTRYCQAWSWFLFDVWQQKCGSWDNWGRYWCPDLLLLLTGVNLMLIGVNYIAYCINACRKSWYIPVMKENLLIDKDVNNVCPFEWPRVHPMVGFGWMF